MQSLSVNTKDYRTSETPEKFSIENMREEIWRRLGMEDSDSYSCTLARSSVNLETTSSGHFYRAFALSYNPEHTCLFSPSALPNNLTELRIDLPKHK